MIFKRLILSAVTALLLPVICPAQYIDRGYGDLDDSETVASMKEQVSFFASAALEGRKAGSEGEKEAALYFAEQLESIGVDIISPDEGDVFGIKQENGDTLTSRNVIGFIPGYDKKLNDHYIVVGARLDNLGTYTVNIDGVPTQRINYGANGNASGLAMLLQLAKKLNTNSILIRRSILIVAFGSSLESGAGAWYFLNRSFGDAGNIDAMINLDMLGTGSNGFYAYTSSNADMNQIVTALKGTLQPVQPEIVSQEPCMSDHRIFYDRQIPSIFFTTGMFPGYNTYRDTPDILQYEEMERETEYIYNYTLSLANGPKPIFNPSEELRKGTEGQEKVFAYYECDRGPAFLGHTNPEYFLKEWVYRYVKYPQKAIEEGIQGRVLVDFIITEKGKVTDVKVLKGVHPLLDEEAVRVVSSSIDWKAGIVKGQKVKSEISLYVEFRLERKR